METNNRLREALTKILNITNSFDENCAVEQVEIRDIAKAALVEIRDIARAALAEPVKNCEVGTVEEQSERFDAFCQSNMKFYKDMFGHDDEGRLDGWDCREDCPVGRMIDSGTAVADHCRLAWAQMPCEEGGNK